MSTRARRPTRKAAGGDCQVPLPFGESQSTVEGGGLGLGEVPNSSRASSRLPDGLPFRGGKRRRRPLVRRPPRKRKGQASSPRGLEGAVLDVAAAAELLGATENVVRARAARGLLP